MTTDTAQQVTLALATASVVDAFGARHGDWLADPWQAREVCAEVSENFVARCLEAGVPARVVSGIEFGEVPEFPGVRLMLNGHYAALVAGDEDKDDDGADGLVYDWTARQFDAQAPVPLVCSLPEWRQRWSASPETMPPVAADARPAGGAPAGTPDTEGA